MTPPVRHRRPPTIATTLAAAALAGELVVAALATAPPASAQTGDPPTADASDSHASDSHASDSHASDAGDSDPAPPEPEEPAAPEPAPAAPPSELPDPAPPENAVPEMPPAGPPAAAPVRSGYAADLASGPSDGGTPDGIAPSPRRGADDDDRPVAEAHARTGRDASAATPTRTPTRTGTRGGRAPARGRHAARATPDRRAHRAASSRTLPGAPPAGAAPTEHTIAPGEHLWGIAAANLAELTARPVSSLRAEEIAPYWARLCMLNAARLRSGNLNLVYPGEVVELPPR